jgi:hypothetical protein
MNVHEVMSDDIGCRPASSAVASGRSRRCGGSAQAAGGTGRATITGDAVWSNTVTHPPLVTEKDFVAAQQVRAERATCDGGKRSYQLRGLLRCGHCGRPMDAHWVHQRAGYRCRHGYRSTTSRPSGAPENLYDAPSTGEAAVGRRRS